MSDLPACPKCQSALPYEDAGMLVCPECAHEWSPGAAASAAAAEPQGPVVRDAFGTPLADGDHDIGCRIDGIGAMGLKSEFVKKS